jgi:serine/threonine-protein kinase ATR
LWKGKTFEIPERVPFRLTQNLVAAMGVTKTEGVFRKASEISMGILRDNAESLMSVLEAFVHDPLVEWTSRVSILAPRPLSPPLLYFRQMQS